MLYLALAAALVLLAVAGCAVWWRKRAAYYNWRGMRYAKFGLRDAAVRYFSKAIAVDPSQSSCYVNRAIALIWLGCYEAAARDAERAIELAPHEAEGYFERGQARHWSGDLEGALRDYAKAIEIRPDHAPAHLNWGILLRRGGDVDAAIVHFDKALETDPDLPVLIPAYYERGIVRFAQGRYGDAVAEFTQALELAPSITDVRDCRGAACLLNGDYEQAVRDFRGVLGVNPTAQTHDGKGWAHFHLGQLDEAEKEARKALALEPDRHGAHALLVRIEMARGHRGEAERLARERLAIPPADEMARQAHLLFRYFLGEAQLDDLRDDSGQLPCEFEVRGYSAG